MRNKAKIWFALLVLAFLSACLVLKNSAAMVSHARAPELDGAISWLNVERPLSLRGDLQGKLVLLDFWTFCCINCMHVMGDLRKLEEKYGDKLAVVGVHSAKFSNEKDNDNIRRAILRYDIRHPVVNDGNFAIWKAFDVHAWPTFVLIDPDGNIAFEAIGEGQYEALDTAISSLLRIHADRVSTKPLPLALEKNKEPPALLSFPGKVLADESRRALYISDSGNNRIVISDFDGNVLTIAGSGREGARDGDFGASTFNHPQGMIASGGFLYVADTGNHLLRKIDLEKHQVSTVLGTGLETDDRIGGKKALRQGLNSPWDLAQLGNSIFIAMAGLNQIWEYAPETGVARAVLGSGREGIVDGAGAAAALAQPSGISVEGETLYIADSEASAIRAAHPVTREVRTVFGHGLHVFGDADGDGSNARLQHPIGVAIAHGTLYVADSYNHKIKQVDLASRTITSLAGNGAPGRTDGAFEMSSFSEPSGLSYADGRLYIADTNNNAIRVLDLAKREVRTLAITLPAAQRPETAGAAGFLPNLSVSTLEKRVVDRGKPLGVELKLDLEKGYHLNTEAPSSMTVSFDGNVMQRMPVKEDLVTMSIQLPEGAESGTLRMDSTLYYCNTPRGACLIKSFSFLQPLEFTSVDIQGEPVVRFEAPLSPP